MTEIRVQNLCKTYGDHVVLHNLSFTAGVGVTRILGRSGAGKTTLLRILLGLDQPDSGSLFRHQLPMGSSLSRGSPAGTPRRGRTIFAFALGSAYNAAAAKSVVGRTGLSRCGQQADLRIFRRHEAPPGFWRVRFLPLPTR